MSARSRIKRRMRRARERYILSEYFFCSGHLYEFESNQDPYPNVFLRVLTGFGITPEDLYIVDMGVDYSQIQFRTDHRTRVAIEYVFREFVGLPRTYLMGVDHTESSLEITCNDGYVIW